MKLENLVCLVVRPDRTLSVLKLSGIDLDPARVRVFIDEGIWMSYTPLARVTKSKQHSIGKGTPDDGSPFGDFRSLSWIIGIYDLANMQHLTNMAQDAYDLDRSRDASSDYPKEKD